MFRWLNGEKQLPKVIHRVILSDGVEITKATSHSAA
jgi:hypothetical protein